MKSATRRVQLTVDNNKIRFSSLQMSVPLFCSLEKTVLFTGSLQLAVNKKKDTLIRDRPWR